MGITANGTVVNGNDGGNIFSKENKKRSSGGLSSSTSLSPMAAKMHPKIHSNGNTQSLSVLIENNDNGQNDQLAQKSSEKDNHGPKSMRKKQVKFGNNLKSSSKVSFNIDEFSIVRLRSIKTIRESLYLEYLPRDKL